MSFKTGITLVIIVFTPLLLQGMNEEAVQLIPDQKYSINNAYSKTSHSSCCPNTYNHYSLSERGCCSLASITPALCCLGIREVASDCVWAQDQTTSFARAHTQVWCSQEAWLPWICDTKQEACTSIAINCATATTIASVAYALCLFLPCVSKKGCTFSKKQNGLEYEK